jgi:hypothetical protein
MQKYLEEVIASLRSDTLFSKSSKLELTIDPLRLLLSSAKKGEMSYEAQIFLLHLLETIVVAMINADIKTRKLHARFSTRSQY